MQKGRYLRMNIRPIFVPAEVFGDNRETVFGRLQLMMERVVLVPAL